MMQTIITIHLLLALLSSAGSASPPQASGLLLDDHSPAVYIRLDHRGVLKSPNPKSGSKAYWLRLYNNTKEAIRISTDSLYIGAKVFPLTLEDGSGVLALRNGVAVSVCYMVEALDSADQTQGEGIRIPEGYYRRLLEGNMPDTRAVSWIAAGSYIRFEVPAEFLAPGHRIVVPFYFGWEKSLNNIEHTVIFSAADIP